MKSIPWKTILIATAVVAIVFRVQQVRKVVTGQ